MPASYRLVDPDSQKPKLHLLTNSMYLIKKIVVIKKILFERARRSINSIEVMEFSVPFGHTYQEELQLC